MPSRTFEETALMKMSSLEVHQVAKVVLNNSQPQAGIQEESKESKSG